MAAHIYFLTKSNKIFVLVAGGAAGIDGHIIIVSDCMVLWKKLPQLGIFTHGLSSECVVCLKGILQRSFELRVFRPSQMPPRSPADTVCCHKVIEHECT